MKYLLAGLAISFVLRLWITRDVLMLGDDTLGYLASLEALKAWAFEGNEWRHALGGLYLWPFVETFGANTGSKVAAILASLFMGVPFYLIARRVVYSDAVAVGAALSFVWINAYGFVLGYGFMTLLSISIGLTSFWLMLKYVESEALTGHGLKYALASGVLGASLMFTNISALLPFVAITGAFGVTLIRSNLTLDAAGIIVMIALFSFALVVAAFASFGLTADDMTLRPIPVALITLAIGLAVAIYARMYIEGIEGNFIFSAAIILALLSTIGSNASEEISVSFGRLWLWRWIPLVLVSAAAAESAYWWLSERMKFPEIRYIAAFILVGGLVYFYNISIRDSMAVHSTLTPETNAIIAMLEDDEAKEKIYVAPESLGWHVAARTSYTPVGPKFWKDVNGENNIPETRLKLVKDSSGVTFEGIQ